MLSFVTLMRNCFQQLFEILIQIAVGFDNSGILFSAVAHTLSELVENSLNLIQLVIIYIACFTRYYELLAAGNQTSLFCHQALQMQALILGKFKNQVLVIFNSIRLTYALTLFNHLRHTENRTHIGNLPFLFQAMTQLFNQCAAAVLSSKSRLLQLNHSAALNTLCLTALIHTLSELNLILTDKQRYSADFLKVHAYRIVNADAFGNAHVFQLTAAGLIIIFVVSYQRQYIFVGGVVIINKLQTFTCNNLIDMLNIFGRDIFQSIGEVHYIAIGENTLISFTLADKLINLLLRYFSSCSHGVPSFLIYFGFHRVF